MTVPSILHIVIYFAVVLALTKPLGAYMHAVFQGESAISKRVFSPVERFVYRLFFVDEKAEMDWRRYALSVMMFSAISTLAVYAILRAQGHLPLNPQNLPGTTSHSAFNTAASFSSNTNWQSYGGETTMSYLSQMLALTVQNFASAAVGIVVVIVLVRGCVRKTTTDLGNFWVDLTRCTLWILLPLSVVLAILLVSQGVIQNFNSYTEVTTVEGASQILAMGPAASQVAIKQLGTNGGGFFNANSAVPFENPIYFLTTSALMLLVTAMAVSTDQGRAGPLNAGALGYSEILYAASSGALAGKQKVPATAGTLPTDSPLFTGFLVGVVIIVGGLTFFPALTLGPIAEHFLVHAGMLS